MRPTGGDRSRLTSLEVATAALLGQRHEAAAAVRVVLALLGEGTEVGEWVVRAQGGAIFPTTLEGHGSAWLLFAAAYARAMLCLQPDSVPSVR